MNRSRTISLEHLSVAEMNPHTDLIIINVWITGLIPSTAIEKIVQKTHGSELCKFLRDNNIRYAIIPQFTNEDRELKTTVQIGNNSILDIPEDIPETNFTVGGDGKIRPTEEHDAGKYDEAMKAVKDKE